ncbi:unnamed protein product [Calypogeia fissa]
MALTDGKQRQKGWVKALDVEDCVQLRELLCQDPALLRLRWEERNALHVAARRGDVKLVKEMLKVHAGRVELLEGVDKSYGLDALAMAVINGNREIVNLLKQASRESESNPYNIDLLAEDGLAEGESNRRDDIYAYGFPDCGETGLELDFATARDTLERITRDLLGRCPKSAQVEAFYKKDYNFNFLDVNLFLFHFSFSAWQTEPDKALFAAIRKIQEVLFAKARESKILRYLLVKLRDGQGRTVLHVAVDSEKVPRFFELIKPTGPGEKIIPSPYLNVYDSVGRTPLYRAVAQNKLSTVKQLLRDERTEIDMEDSTRVIATLCIANGIGHVGGEHSDPENVAEGFTLEVGMLQFQAHEEIEKSREKSTKEEQLLACFHLAAAQSREKSTKEEQLLACFHLAAALGKPEFIKVFLDRNGGKFNPLLTDARGNTALHHAMLGRNYAQLQPHMVDFVSCSHVFGRPRDSGHYRILGSLANPYLNDDARLLDYMSRKEEESYGHRMGSVNLLLQVGISIWEPNNEGRTARPEADAPGTFVEWWYKKVAQETQQEQQTLNAAANAVSVTAALVATASYVGPLTPPLGFGGDPLSLQVDILALRIFVICNTLSFFLALAAIMLALAPSLPMIRSSVFRDLVRTRMLVTMAVSCLFPSIICVLLAFAAAYSAVIPNNGLAYHGLGVGAIAISGAISLFAMYMFVTSTRWFEVLDSYFHFRNLFKGITSYLKVLLLL